MDRRTKCSALLVMVLGAVFSTTAFRCERLRGINGSCYIINKTPMTWREALYDCISRYKGNLAMIETEREAEALRERLQSSSLIGYYVGGLSLDVHRSGIWYETGSLLATRGNLWEPGQRDSVEGHNGNCAIIGFVRSRGRRGGQSRLADVSCTSQHGYICQVPVPDYSDYFGDPIRIEERSNDITVG